MSATRFTAVRDLEQWVAERTPGLSDDDRRRVVIQIQYDRRRPAWGRDWSAYLDSLPELVELAS